MEDEKKDQPEVRRHEDNEIRSLRLDSIGWGLFLVWVGFAFLFDIGWGWGLLGIAAIILGEAAYRRSVGLKVEGFWIVVGILLGVGGVWELFHVPLPLAPILIILCGAAVLWGVLNDQHLMKK